ncbi:hypothetical protein DFH29DRAFT_875514 [Suillus ampliporus]|nr:hypothetical protein DFH29DRAFT_875514 [Suillus ampliporus]
MKQSNAPPQPKVPHAQWNDNEVTALVNYLYEHRTEGEGGGGFKQHSFNNAAEYLNTKEDLKANWQGPPKTWSSVRNKWTTIKGIYNAIENYHNQTGVHWNNVNGAGIDRAAAGSVWTTYLKTNGVMRPFCNKGWEHYKKMEAIIPLGGILSIQWAWGGNIWECCPTPIWERCPTNYRYAFYCCIFCRYAFYCCGFYRFYHCTFYRQQAPISRCYDGDGDIIIRVHPYLIHAPSLHHLGSAGAGEDLVMQVIWLLQGEDSDIPLEQQAALMTILGLKGNEHYLKFYISLWEKRRRQAFVGKLIGEPVIDVQETCGADDAEMMG